MKYMAAESSTIMYALLQNLLCHIFLICSNRRASSLLPYFSEHPKCALDNAFWWVYSYFIILILLSTLPYSLIYSLTCLLIHSRVFGGASISAIILAAVFVRFIYHNSHQLLKSKLKHLVLSLLAVHSFIEASAKHPLTAFLLFTNHTTYFTPHASSFFLFLYTTRHMYEWFCLLDVFTDIPTAQSARFSCHRRLVMRPSVCPTDRLLPHE